MFPSFDNLIESEFAQNCILLDNLSFQDPEAAVASLTRLHAASLPFEDSRDGDQTHSVPPWYKTLRRILLEAPFPEQVLDAVDQFVNRVRVPESAFRLFEQTPRSLEVLARLSCGSPFLTQCLLAQPEALSELTTERRTAEMKDRETFREEAILAITACDCTEQELTELRRYQRREILRIGMCDAFGLLDLKYVTLQISLLADAMVQVCLDLICRDFEISDFPFSVIALGKLGGEELNYSSDIDLVLIAHNADRSAQKLARKLIDALTVKLTSGFLYRVDMRLRPWGDAGPLVSTPDSYRHYLQNDAEAWEKQALLKARVIAGDTNVGAEFLEQLPALLFSEPSENVITSVRRMKDIIEERLAKSGKLHSEVKLGAGSIRDIEFLAQALQLIHGRNEPRLASANTLDALVRLAEFDVLDAVDFRRLREGYIFLRTIEHALQLLHNQQTHELPQDEIQLQWLARRLDFQSSQHLLLRFDEHRHAIRRIFDAVFHTTESQENATTTAVVANEGTIDVHADAVVIARWLSERPARIERNHQLLADAVSASTVKLVCDSSNTPEADVIVTLAGPATSGLLSMICGILFANHLDIREGFAQVGPAEDAHGHSVPEHAFLGMFLVRTTESRNSVSLDGMLSRRIEDELTELLSLQQQGQKPEVRHRLLNQFCQRLKELPAAHSPKADLHIDVHDAEDVGRTKLTIEADDSPGFLFELSNALTLCSYRVHSAEVGASDGRIHDVLYVTEADGQAVKAPDRIEELRTAITLIKQFTNWLPSTNAPFQALSNFRDLLQQLLRNPKWQRNAESLRQPKVLRAISRVLGLSRYLWEDFVQVHPDQLLQLLTEPDRLQQRVPRDQLVAELNGVLTETASLDDARHALSTFREQHLFRIDLRHVLGHCGPFGAFSEEITELAEVLVEAATQLGFAHLAETHGAPKLADDQPCGFTLAALGKFGGVEMGFASDIEVFLVFEDDCRTVESRSLSAASFFERLMNLIPELIESRRKGIFEIDLRMRPYGQAGSTAVSLQTFEGYYSAAGDAWPYERQSLVKLRCIGGDPHFAQKLDQIARQLVYSAEAFDFDAMRAMREKQVRQLVRGGTLNAKLSHGGLVDCEYAIQALQLRFGKKHPALQTPNTLQALTAAMEASLLTKSAAQPILHAYRFLRELIDCLRMARGNAEDLTVPERDTSDYFQLEKRMQSVHDSTISLDEIEQQMTQIRQFSAVVEQICLNRTS